MCYGRRPDERCSRVNYVPVVARSSIDANPLVSKFFAPVRYAKKPVGRL